MRIIFAFLCVIGGTLASKVRYDGHQVHRVLPNTDKQAQTLRAFVRQNKGFDFWTSSYKINGPIDIIVPPYLSEIFRNFLYEHELESSLHIENIQDLIENERPKIKSAGFGWTDYYPYDDIIDWLENLVETYPDLVSIITVGKSYENRDIKGVHISFSPENVNNSIFMESGIHAAEWIGPATSTYILNEILTNTDPTVRNTVERYDWYFVPVYNPDGYEFSHTSERMWRKTRAPYTEDCIGVDPNRNWAFAWNTGGASDDPCDNEFAGPYPFSESESKTISEYISSLEGKLIGYFAFHSAGQILAFPYGHTGEHLENYDDLYSIGLKAVETLAGYFGTEYTVGNIFEIIALATGGAGDWVKGTFGTPIVYTYELRDKWQQGPILPADQIIPSGIETFYSLLRILDEFNEIL